jgi:hypothetical protein
VVLLGPLSSEVLLPLLRPPVAVRPVSPVLELSPGFRHEDGLERFFVRVRGTGCAVPCSALQTSSAMLVTLCFLRTSYSFLGDLPLIWTHGTTHYDLHPVPGIRVISSCSSPKARMMATRVASGGVPRHL